MTLDRPFRLSVLTMVGTALAALTVALGSMPWLLAVLALFLLYLVISSVRPQWQVSRGTATVLVVLALQGVLVEVIATQTVLVPAGHFLIITQFVWLTQKRSTRHTGWLCLVSLLQMMLAGVLSVDLAFGVCLLIYLPAGVVTLMLFNLRCELERRGLCSDLATPATASHAPRLGRRLLTSAGFVTAAELVLTILVFLYFPRFGLQILQLRPVQKGPRLSGFSDRVEFGDIARILDNPEVVMSVRLSRGGRPIQAEGFPLLWRGVSLDTYEDGVWSTKGFFDRNETHPHRLDYPEPTPRVNEERDVIQEVALEPVNSRVLFHLPRLVELRKASPNLEEIDVHLLSRTFTSAGSSSVSLRYIVRSRPPDWTVEELRRPPPGARLEGNWLERMARAAQRPKHRAKPWHDRYAPDERFLQIPDSLSPRLARLAHEIVAEFPAEEVYKRIRKVETYLKSHYDYTTEYGRVARGADPVEDFLFRRRAGHCEHFAAAMVVLLRSLNIPARMVTGFRGGEWNEYGGFYVIRQRHAHAWVEARLPITKHMWMSFDPTPAAAAAPTEYGWLARLSRRFAFLRLQWNSWVVNYSSTDQRNLAHAMTRWLSQLPNFLPLFGRGRLALDSGASLGRGIALILAIVLVLGGALFLWFWLRRRSGRRARRRGRPGRPAVAFYRRMDDLLRRRGFERTASDTPLEFASHVLERGGTAYAPVERLSHLFCRVFYGGQSLSADERGEVRQALDALAAVPRRRRLEA
jgi:transglutaminase-like putative cysteine protease